MNTNTRETWRRIDDLQATYSRLAERRAAAWSQLAAHRMAGAERQARRLERDLFLLDCQGLALAERIDDLCAAALGSIDETPRF